MAKWLPSTFSDMPSKATGTTPSRRGNKHHLDAIIPHQVLSFGCRIRSRGGCHWLGARKERQHEADAEQNRYRRSPAGSAEIEHRGLHTKSLDGGTAGVCGSNYLRLNTDA